MSQLGLGLGLSNVSSLLRFSPLDLDPYLLFDTQSSMIGTFENPTLDLDPSNPSTLDVITATRAGVATYTDEDGLIQSASADTVRVDYTQGAELTPTVFQHVVQTDYSASPNVIGTKVTLSDISGPDGESGGVRVTETANNTQHYLAVKNKEIASGTTYTVSFYVKEGAYPSVKFYTQSAKIYSDVTFNFSTGTATFGGPDLIANSGSVSNVGGGWYRVVYSATANGSGEMDLYVCSKDLSSYAGDVNNFTDYYGFQVEEGTTASSFVENTTGSPKFITGATYGPRVPMILVEPSATNLVTDSNTFNKASAVVRLGTDFEGPDGTNTAEGYGSIPATNGEKVYSQAASISPNTEYVCSVWVKGEAGKTTSFFAKRSGGTYVSSNTVTVTLAGGWQRVTGMVMTTLSDNTGITINLLGSASATQADEVYLWGAQLEAGSVATSYIPTSGGDAAARTRAADDLVVSGSAFSDFYNQSEGTVYAEFIPKRVDNYRHLFEFSNGTTSNRMNVNLLNSNAIFYIRTGGTDTVNNVIASNVTTEESHRIACSYKNNDARASFDGGSEIIDTVVTLPPQHTKMFIGDYTPRDGNYILTGHIKRLIYWPYHSDSL